MNDRGFGTVGGGHYRGSSHDLFERIISPENLFAAWREFRLGKRSKSDVQELEFAVEDIIFGLHEELALRTWRHEGYTPFFVTDPKVRHIHKATVRDRLLHHAVFRVLYPIFDRRFIHDSYSCRVNKGTHRAVRRLEQYTRQISQNNQKNVWALKCDVRRFFDSVSHEILLRLIQRRIQDPDALWLVEGILNSFSKSPGVGIPLGNVTSQLFANIYLNELDRFIKHALRRPYYLRYCDDFLILGDDPDELEEIKDRIAEFLISHLQLSLHPNKITIRKYGQGIDFLGYVVRPYHTVLRAKTRRRLLEHITSDNAASYFGMLKHCDGYALARQAREMVKRVRKF